MNLCDLCGKPLATVRTAALVQSYRHPDGSEGIGALCPSCQGHVEVVAAPQGGGVFISLEVLATLEDDDSERAAAVLLW